MSIATSNRSDYIKVIASVIPQAALYSIIWIKIVSWSSMLGKHEDTIYQFLILLTISILPVLIGNILRINRNIEVEKEKSIINVFLSNLSHSMTIIFVVLYFQTQNMDKYSITGHTPKTTIQIIDLLVTSLFTFFIVSILFGIVKKFNLFKWIIGDQTEFINNDLLLFETSGERILAVIMVVLRVIGEELIYRGYLIIYLGGIANQYFLFCIFSVIFTVIGHLYQGKDQTIYHLFLSILFAVTAYIYNAIFISITIHILLNLSDTFSLWRKIDKENI